MTVTRDRGLLAACGLMAVACAAAYGGIFSHAYPGDTGTYSTYGRLLVEHGQIPYRDFFDEYPPGSVPVFALPALIWNAHYVLVFKLLMTACAMGFTACSAWILRRLGLSAVRVLAVAVAPLLVGPVFLNRYDPLPALLVSLSLVALLRSRDRTTGALLGIGTAIKIYPAVVLPLLLRRVSPKRAGGAFVIAGAVLVLPFFALAPGGVGYSLKTQLVRHLQIESLGSSLLLTGSKLGIHHVGWFRGKPGSIDLSGSLADIVGVLSSVLAVALVLYIAWLYRRGPAEDRRLVTAFAAAVAAFTIFGKVLSPQYLVWLVPLVPLAAGRRGVLASGTFLAALALSMPEYLSGNRHGLERETWTVWVLLLRNGLLVSTFCLLASALHQREGFAKGS